MHNLNIAVPLRLECADGMALASEDSPDNNKQDGEDLDDVKNRIIPVVHGLAPKERPLSRYCGRLLRASIPQTEPKVNLRSPSPNERHFLLTGAKKSPALLGTFRKRLGADYGCCLGVYRG